VKKKLLFLSRILVTIILISILWFFLKDNIDELLITLKAANKGLLVFGFALFCLNVVILSMRLICVLRTQNIKLTLRESVIINFTASFIFFISPCTTLYSFPDSGWIHPAPTTCWPLDLNSRPL